MVITENTQPHDYLEEAIQHEKMLRKDLEVIFKRIKSAKENAKNGKSWEESIKDTIVFINGVRTGLMYTELRCGDALEEQRGKKNE